MAESAVGGHVRGFLKTTRTDAWWWEPAITGGAFATWVLYYTWVVLTAKDYAVGPYLSPFFSPLLIAGPDVAASAHHAWLPWSFPGWWPSFVPKSPAMFIAIFPASFRLTCYYYRKFYYRAYFGSPPGCAVGAVPQARYRGETFLLVFQNLHRYAFYFALALIPFLWIDAIGAFFYEGKLGFGVGTVVMLLNAWFLTGYTIGCHAWRHLVGGKLNCFSCDGTSQARFQLWNVTTWFNGRHMAWAWTSLIWIACADIYVRLVATGTIPDLHTWGTF